MYFLWVNCLITFSLGERSNRVLLVNYNPVIIAAINGGHSNFILNVTL